MSDVKKQKLERVTLKVSHTHAGKDYKVGDAIEVPPHVKAYLKRRGKID